MQFLIPFWLKHAHIILKHINAKCEWVSWMRAKSTFFNNCQLISNLSFNLQL